MLELLTVIMNSIKLLFELYDRFKKYTKDKQKQ